MTITKIYIYFLKYTCTILQLTYKQGKKEYKHMDEVKIHNIQKCDNNLLEQILTPSWDYYDSYNIIIFKDQAVTLATVIWSTWLPY